MRKKILAMFVAVLGISAAASAQIVAGGSLGYMIDTKAAGPNLKMTTWNFSPRIGFAVSDALEVGAYLGMECDVIKDKDDADILKTRTTRWNIAPYARFRAAQMDKLSVKGELMAQFSNGSVKTTVMNVETKVKGNLTYAVVLRPVLVYSASDNIDVEFGLNFLNLGFWHDGKEDNRFGLNATTSGSTLGVAFRF